MATARKKGSGGMVVAAHLLVGLFGLLVVMLGIAFTLGYLLGRNQYDARLRVPAGDTSGFPFRIKPVNTPALPRSSSAASAANPQTRVSKRNSSPLSPNLTDPPPDWDFYHSGEPAKPLDRVAETPAPVQPSQAGARSSASGLNGDSQPVPAPHSAAVVPEKSARETHEGRDAELGDRPAGGGRTKTESDAPNHFSSIKSGNPAGILAPKTAPPPVPPSLVSKSIPRGSSVLQVASVGRQTDAVALAQALQKKKFPAFILPPATDRFYRVQVGPYRDAQLAKAAQKKLEQQGFKTIVKR